MIPEIFIFGKTAACSLLKEASGGLFYMIFDFAVALQTVSILISSPG